MRFGVHISIGAGFMAALDQATALGCDGFQIFAGNPRGWERKPLVAAEAQTFAARRRQAGLGPLMVHLSYLPNLASADPVLYQKSVTALAEDLRRANLLGADFFVFHPGRALGQDHPAAIKQVITSVNSILADISGPTQLLFENQAGGSSEIAATFSDLGTLLAGVEQPERVGVCFDTCHAFAAGYDLRSATAWERTMAAFEQKIGLARLKIFHINDALGDCGSHLDRHQHIGAGTIGLEGFRYLVNHAEYSTRAGILETPQKEATADQQNLAVLRGLVKGDHQ